MCELRLYGDLLCEQVGRIREEPCAAVQVSHQQREPFTHPGRPSLLNVRLCAFNLYNVCVYMTVYVYV